MRRVFAAGVVCLGVAISTTVVYGQGWQPEQLLYHAPGAQPDQKQSCGQIPSTKVLVCVYEAGVAGYLDLHEVQSDDGGVSWSAPIPVTGESGDEFDPYIAVDTHRNKLWLLYSHNSSPGNELILRDKLCATCFWSNGSPVVSDGANHWDAGLVVLANGDLLALEQFEGFDGSASGKIRSIRSSDAGATWQAPSIILDEPGEETFPRAVQRADGSLLLMFRDSSHGSKLQIGQVLSDDNGYTWRSHSVFRFNPRQHQWFSFIGGQGGSNITVIAGIGGYISHWQSWDDGSSWRGPYRISAISDAWDAEMTLGCRGPIFTLTASEHSIWVKRYDWYTTCR